MTAGSDVVVRRQYSADTVEEGRELLEALYTGNKQKVSAGGHTGDYHCGLDSASAGTLSVDRLQIPLSVDAHADAFDVFISVIPFGLPMEFSAAGEHCQVTPDTAGIYRPGHDVNISWTDELDIAIVRFPVEEVSRAAGEVAGIDPVDFRFESGLPVSPVMSRYWRSVSMFTAHQLRSPDSALNDPLVQADTRHTLALAALRVFPNTATTAQYMPGPGRVAPAAARRAVAYIEANAANPVTLSDIAEAAGTSARALQQAFLRYYDVTPTGYLRRTRLEHAHRELLTGDPATGVSVSMIARRWGFNKPSRFATAYRDAYGVLPSHTLRT